MMRTRKIIKIVLVYAFIITGICVGYRMNIMAAGPENISITLNRSSDFETSKRLRWYLNGNWANTGGGRYTLYNGSNYHSTNHPGRTGFGYIVIDRPGTYRIEWSFESYNDRKTYTTTAMITINDYEFNKAPVITVDNIDKIINKSQNLNMTGLVKDDDNDSVKISATINGVTKTQSITSTETEKSYILTWSGSELEEGVYTNIIVRASDTKDESLANYTGDITIDKTPPTPPTVTQSITVPTNQNVLLTPTYSADSVTKQYKLSTSSTWSNYTNPITVTTNSTYQFRGIDLAGNISTVKSHSVSNIDKIKPKLNINIR